jgi:hypothetical protein
MYAGVPTTFFESGKRTIVASSSAISWPCSSGIQ